MTAAAAVLDLLFPPRCAGCGRGGSAWCAGCAASLEPVPTASLNGVRLVAAARLTGPWQAAIHTYKYLGRPQLARPLAAHLRQAILTAALPLAGLTVVPLHPARQKSRGFNQAERLGQCLADWLRLPLYPGLQRRRDTPPQVGLDEAARRRNVAGAFRWLAAEPPPGGLGLIDDVCTTGSTLRAAASALREAGAAPAAFLVLAVAPVQTLPIGLVTRGRVLGDTSPLGDST